VVSAILTVPAARLRDFSGNPRQRPSFGAFDAWVVYAGPFRSFGQLLILNAGGGYYILLAGMQRIDVALNQFVLAGEPVATMGETSEAAATTVGWEPGSRFCISNSGKTASRSTRRRGGRNRKAKGSRMMRKVSSFSPAPSWARA
jgi:hypothetical protein